VQKFSANIFYYIGSFVTLQKEWTYGINALDSQVLFNRKRQEKQ
jgi:hypothetical protein